MLNFSQYLRQGRLANGLTMQQLASRLLVSPQFISLLESGKRFPSDKLVQRCAAEFQEDLNYLRFLAQPIPEAQKRALLESPSAPDYLPESARTNVLIQDSDDVLMESLLAVPRLPKPEEDAPYFFVGKTALDESDLALPLQLLDRTRRDTARFGPKIRAWADFYEAYYTSHLEGRLGAYEALRSLHERLASETAVAYPLKLRFIVALHLGLCERENEDSDAAERLFQEASERAHAALQPGLQACALWSLADLRRSVGDTFGALETLDAALAIPDIPPFGIARCLSDAVEARLILEEDERVLEDATDAIRLWRSSTLDAPQDVKSLHLVRMEIGAFASALRLDREEEGRSWLSRIRSMRVRIDLPDEEDARVALSTGILLASRGRNNQARGHLEHVVSAQLGHEDIAQALKATAHVELAGIETGSGRFSEAEDALRNAGQTDRLTSPVHE
ncbi:MAG: helix-turn-helix transcriptional regulator, partial [SAR202 cluster bacterium]|nr:helix-turn-helix transcriptional regulator [SAR202 cluster bacterium]